MQCEQIYTNDSSSLMLLSASDKPSVREVSHGRDNESADKTDRLPTRQGGKYSTEKEMGKR